MATRRLRSNRFNRSAIMTRAWELARVWHAEARSFHFASNRAARASPFALKRLRRSAAGCVGSLR
jgi:hypothetical protein